MHQEKWTYFLWFSYFDSEMASSPRKRTSPTIANDGKAFARPVEEEISVIIKWQDDIIKDPLTIKDNVKEEERNSLDIKWQDDNLEDPLSIKDNIKQEEENSLDIKWQDDILKDPLSIKDEGEYIIEGKIPSIIYNNNLTYFLFLESINLFFDF